MPLPRIPKRGAAGETARLMQGQFNVTTPPGIVLNQSTSGQSWIDQNAYPFPAKLIGNGTGSGPRGGWGSGHSTWQDFTHHYDWAEVIPVNINDELKFVIKENGRTGTSETRPAVEANGATDVAEEMIVYLYPGTVLGQEPEWYYFFAGEGIGSGSGTDGEFTTLCPDGGTFKVRISGTTVTVTET